MPNVLLAEPIQKRLHGRFRGGIAAAAIAVASFALVGLVYNAIGILRLPQSGLKALELVWVLLAACVLVVVFATAAAAGLERLGQWVTPKPPSEEWQREELRHRSLAARHAAQASAKGRPSGGATASPGSSSAA